jgi:predicted negative regulator of RcsB-dependent stress response
MALARRYEEAFILFNDEALKGYGELDYWRAYTLAWLEDWEQAQNVSPSDLDVLIAYPIVLLERVGIKLAEVALRNGKLDEAEELLKVLEDKRRETSESTKNGIRYLRGVVKQLEGNLDEAEEYWTDLLESNDDFYRARAGLAMILTRQGIQTISVEKAIDLLEGLRFTWRGDEIEARTLFSLGKFYVEDDQYIKGLSILRDAAGLRPDSDVSQEIARNMRLIFEDLILVDEDITALEATSVFEEFKELTPVDQAGRRLVQRLAERMVEADLLGRAAELLRFQVDFRLEGEEKANIATRLATIYILDEKNDEALGMLKLADNLYKSLFQRESYTSKNVELSMLKAQALFQSGLSEEALDVLIALDPKPTINKLRADIAWQSALWADAAEALDYIMQDKDLYSATSLSEANSDLILNRAVALNLASDRVELSSLRNRFLVEMNKTSNARLFDVVTRPRQTSIIAGEDTLETLVEEVSIFSDFMESYKKNK